MKFISNTSQTMWTRRFSVVIDVFTEELRPWVALSFTHTTQNLYLLVIIYSMFFYVANLIKPSNFSELLLYMIAFERKQQSMTYIIIKDLFRKYPTRH